MAADGTVLADIDEDKNTIGYGDLTIATQRTLPVVRKPHMYALMAQDTLESYTFSQFGLPPAGIFAVAAVDPGPSATPWAAAAAAANKAVQTASSQGQTLKLMVFPAGYFPTADPAGLAKLQSIAVTGRVDLLINLAGTPPLSLLLALDGSTYRYIRTHRRPASVIPTDVLSDDYWVVDRPYARVALMQGVDMLAPETTNVASKMGVDVIAVSASSANPVLSALWKSRTGSNVHIVVANARADEGVYLGGYRDNPSFMEAPGMVIMRLHTAYVRAKKFPRFLDPRPLLQPCGQNNC